MRKVNRLATPQSLVKNGMKWTNKLLAAIKESKKNGTKVPDKFYNKYKQHDILEALKKMYGDKDFTYCCYCESIINDVSFEQIEHRMPKRKTPNKYPQKTYDWNNLHLSCAKCNVHKANKYDETEPILDAAVDDIEQHLGYKISPKGVYRQAITKRGITTVEHADLDRTPLLKARMKIYIDTMKTIRDIIKSVNNPSVYTAKKELRDTCECEHGSLIKYLMIDYGVWS